MSSDEARKLLGGYATGSLTEAERTALFQAALEDQALFEELAGEQVLKEVLDEPGARRRLITVLEPPRHRAWLWVAAVATMAVVAGLVVLSQQTSPPPQQIAQVLKSSEPPESRVTPAARVPRAAPRKVAPASASVPVPASVPAPAPPAELRKDEAAADQLQEAKPQPAAAGAVRQFAAAVARSAFAFNYTVRPEGFLEIVPTARGFLSVAAGDTIIFPSAPIGAGTPVRVPIPPDAGSLVISFSGMQGIAGAPVRRDEASGTVTDQDPPNARIIIQFFLTPGTR